MTNYYFRIAKYLPALLIYFACWSGFSFAQENIVSNETASGAGASSAQKNIVSQESDSEERSTSNQDIIVSDETTSAGIKVPRDIQKIVTGIKKVIGPIVPEAQEREKQATVVKEELKKKEEKLEEAKKEARKALDVDRVMETIKDLGKEMRQDAYFGNLILEDLEMFGIDAFKDSQVMIKFRIKTLPVRQWEVAREFRRRIKNRFDELGIEMPFPHRTLYVRTGSDGEWLQKFTRKYSPDKKIERGMTSDQQGLES